MDAKRRSELRGVATRKPDDIRTLARAVLELAEKVRTDLDGEGGVKGRLEELEDRLEALEDPDTGEVNLKPLENAVRRLDARLDSLVDDVAAIGNTTRVSTIVDLADEIRSTRKHMGERLHRLEHELDLQVEGEGGLKERVRRLEDLEAVNLKLMEKRVEAVETYQRVHAEEQATPRKEEESTDAQEVEPMEASFRTHRHVKGWVDPEEVEHLSVVRFRLNRDHRATQRAVLVTPRLEEEPRE